MMDSLKLAATVEPMFAAPDDADAAQPVELVVSLNLTNAARRGLCESRNPHAPPRSKASKQLI
jgi:hypothetical protein